MSEPLWEWPDSSPLFLGEIWAPWLSAGWLTQKQCIWFLERNIERTFFLRKPLTGKSCFKLSVWISACCPNIVTGMASWIREAYCFYSSVLLPNETFTKTPGADWQIRIPVFKIDIWNLFFAMQMKHSKIIYKKVYHDLGTPKFISLIGAKTSLSFSFMHWLPHYRPLPVLEAAFAVWSEIPSWTWTSCLLFHLNHCTVWG